MRCVWMLLLCWLTAAHEDDEDGRGLFPNVFNLAATSVITVNATCGDAGPEIYCKLVEHVFLRDNENVQAQHVQEPQCSTCDVKSVSPDKRHPIENAIDGTNRWWQSPTLQNGNQFEWVTVTLDLKQVYQIAYIIIKAAVSPRPGNWILERSLDGIIYKPWQYYALTDGECWEAYGIRPTTGKPHYRSDDEVICTSYYSKLNPLENGEIHTSLVNGRPGVDGPSMKLIDFTKARYVRLRLQKIRTLHADLMTMRTNNIDRIDKTVTRRYFYSIKDISVGGQCACSGHAATCSADQQTGKLQCQCQHNTCGENCDRCCPLYSQKTWHHGTTDNAGVCEKCECYGHSDRCHYDQHVADKRLSINADGKYVGGGVCDKCKHHTSGINCEQCEDGFFRPLYVARNHSRPCKKCQCSGIGMTGYCIKDDSHILEGLQPGDCLCKTGFTGAKCDVCDIGYRNFPLCEPCPCHSAGTIGSTTCEGECICKTHVKGTRCDRCRQGFYHLSASNPDGCSQCFCFGLTDECTEADWGIVVVKKIEDWKVTDLKGTRVVRPTPENGNVVIANDDVSLFSSYYWLAPHDYLGKKLYSYGSDLKFTLSYVVARGDTSGTYTESADVVLEGNGLQIGYNWGARPELDEVAISVPLREQGWFLLTPPADRTSSVSREEFTLVLNNLTSLLIRAKFHTDQIEGRLHNIGMEVAAEDSKSLKKLESLEKCVCPIGYAGLSCELCAAGYRSVSGFAVNHKCERCDCYNHAEACDNPTGRCENCLHNTTGQKCERCVRGYYGDATIGTQDDCKPCACPLHILENNFSLSCTANFMSIGNDYTCDQCPEGHDGNKCERCADGYFGNPQVPGGYCQKCDCSDNADTSQSGWCDSLTGQCLKCLGNTAGWNCGECLPYHYGSPEQQYCQACSCNPHGSESSQCDLSTGQCVCKPHFIGRTCNRCADGFGNIEDGCQPCNCNIIGSVSELCDSVSGRCTCKPGVFGVSCDSCLDGYFGFSRHGCQECNCDHLGSTSLQCDESSGQCSCKPYVVGRVCDKCQDGFWNLQSGNGCEECHCNRTGSLASICDKNTGQCNCKSGVGGKFCDQCLVGYFRFSLQGCRRCDPCDKPGHICDPKNGRCVCPPHTRGPRCQKCVPNAWGYDPINGCKLCDCNVQGSPQQNCDPDTGTCICLDGFKGSHCDECRHGFYDFPNCHRCDCSRDGTIVSQCHSEICQCNNRGDCPCKELAHGQKCDQCIDGAFALSADNVKGCFECFCFGKTSSCNQANMHWKQAKVPARDIFMEIGTTDIPSILGFQVIPEDLVGKRIGIPYVLDKPLYWSLPKEYLGDQVLSYNGYLSFNVEGHSSSHFPDALLHRYPLLVLQGNQRVVLVHSPLLARPQMPYRVRLHEDEWKMFDNPLIPVKKSVIAVALQNLQFILIRGTDGADVKYARLHNTSLDVAAAGYSHSVAKGVEMCRCPRQYIGFSCQDPAPGYYRKRKPNFLNSKDILDLVGWAEPCACNNHTSICDKETGICINCGGNTMGDHCERCQKGFYGDTSQGPCRPCACPHPTNSFSDTCVPDAADYICINCQQGYTGRHCERCDSGYYGDLGREGGKCLLCKCNPYGSRSRECDTRTGQCQCNVGVQGRDCTICSHGFILTEYGCKSCEDECTGILLKELYEIQLNVDNTNFTDLPRLPWGYLDKMMKEEQRLRLLVTEYEKNVSLGKDLVDKFTFYLDLEAQADMLLVKVKDHASRAIVVSVDAKDTLDEAEKLFMDLNKIWRNVKDLASELDAHGQDPTSPAVSVERSLMEAERILREIKSRVFDPDKENAERELRKAQNLLNNVKKLTLDRAYVDELKGRLDKLDTLLADLIKKIDEGVRKPAERALETYQIGKLRQREVQGIINDINSFLESSNLTLKEAAELLALANSDLIDAAVKFEYLPRLLRDLGNATDKLDEHRSILAHLNTLYKDKYVIPAQLHADALEKQSQHLTNLFLATKELSEFPLQAAKAYQNIVDAINAAEIAAQEADKAADKAYRQAYPEFGDALTEQADKARARSLQLLAEAQKLNDEKVPELEEKIRKRKKELNDLSEDVAFGKRSNDIINRELDALLKGLGNSLEGIVSKGRAAQERANTANSKANQLLQRLESDLQPKFDSIRAGTVGGLENLTRIIHQAREDMRGAVRLADSADASARRVGRQHELTKLSLKELKDKILLARQKASSIRVGLTTDRNGQCLRSFNVPVEPSTTNNIILNYATKSDAPDSLLFFIGSANEDDFMALEMINRKIRFLWNAGGGTQIIAHNMTIETNNEQFLKNSQWFKIEANRIGNIGTLSVKRTPDGQRPDPFEVSGASPVGFTKMDLDASAYFFIGEFPEDYLPPGEVLSSSFSGCLYEALLDGKPIGLWNFKTNIGCDGCKEGATEDIDITAFEFQGRSSYAIVPQIPYYKKSDLYTVLSFRTLNEDALLFLSCNFQTGQFLSLELREGHVVYQVKLSDKSAMSLRSAKKYNTGQWIRVEASREKFEAQMLVEDEYLQDRVLKGSSSALDLKGSPLYYGGVSPNFTHESFPTISFNNFFGCLKDLQIDSTPIDLSRGSFYGMTVGCSDRPTKVATFNGLGYLELNSQPFLSDSSFSFSYLTQQRDALLLLSTHAEQEGASTELLQNYYSVSLKDGRVIAMFNSGSGEIILTSDNTFSTGSFHTVNVIRKNRKLLLRVDDEEEAEMRLPRGAKDISTPQSGGLFLGGTKSGLNINDMTANHQAFVGVVQDAIFNDRLLRFEKAVSHKGVDFGSQNMQSVPEDSLQQMAPSQPHTECSESADMSLDEEAFSVKDEELIEIFLDKMNASHNFNLSLEYRTYYPEGSIISFANEHKKVYMTTYLEKGLVMMEYAKQNQQKSFKHEKELTIGKWHLVEFTKYGKHLTVHLNKHQSFVLDVGKRLSFRKVYIGSFFHTFQNESNKGNFKGCIRYLQINGKQKHYPSQTPCFKSVEFGTYFTGIGHITQDAALFLNKDLSVSLQFRTAQQDGSLLSIYSRFTNIWFELCLQNNMVLCTLRKDGDLKLQLSINLTSGQSPCSHRWQQVACSFRNNAFTLQLNELKPVQQKLHHTPQDLGFSEVYIGGRPEKYAQYAECGTKFVGCLQKIIINEESFSVRNSNTEPNIVQYSCPQL